MGTNRPREVNSQRINVVAPPTKIRLAAVGDLHYGKTSQGMLQPLVQQLAQAADILLLLGDLTDYGHPEEAQLLAKELSAGVKIPIIGVLGNHDYEAGKETEVQRILE